MYTWMQGGIVLVVYMGSSHWLSCSGFTLAALAIQTGTHTIRPRGDLVCIGETISDPLGPCRFPRARLPARCARAVPTRFFKVLHHALSMPLSYCAVWFRFPRLPAVQTSPKPQNVDPTKKRRI